MTCMSYFLTDDSATFASAFKELRLKAGIDSLRQFCGLLADAGFVVEESTLSRWQGGTRKPKDRQLVLALIKILVMRGALSTTEEANRLLRLVNLVPLSQQEEKQLHLNSSRQLVMPIPATTAYEFDFSGIWRSTYSYTSTAKQGYFTSQYDVRLHHTGSQLTIQSLSTKNKDYLLLRLSVDGRLLTGTWYEQTSPMGDYEGVSRYGALQLIVDEDGQAMRGMWVGFNRKMYMQADRWIITRISDS